MFDDLHLVKLNGSADRLDAGLIFAPQEYGAGSVNVPSWYRELGQNYSTHVFVFIGSSLNEPLLQHVMADMREGSRRSPQRGYLISPHATAIEVRHLEVLKIIHIPGSLEDFVKFLQDKISRGTIVFSERQNIWRRRLRELFEKHASEILRLDRIKKADVDPILGKLERFGPWTRLERMTLAERRKELFDRSSRQLLIGLLETTNGIGFRQIIRRDYADIGSEEHQKLLVTVGLATIHRTAIPVNVVGRALQLDGVNSDALRLVNETEGVVEASNGELAARHPVYIRELFERIANPELIRDCLISLLQAFADYQAPVIRHATKSEGFIFKSIINNRFVRRMMRDNEERVLSVYAEFKTTFHIDGLYWLQYGLALRGFGRHEEALDMFKTAREAYTSPQIEHAYAQQLLIIAERASSWEVAEPVVQEAVQILRTQKDETWEMDSYPIVALAEGHVKVFKRFHSEAESREIARKYANDLQRLRRTITNERLEQAATSLSTYATTGVWTEREVDTEWDT